MKLYIWRIMTSGGFTVDYWSVNKSVKLACDYLNKTYGKQPKDYFGGPPDFIIKAPFVAAIDSCTSRLYKGSLKDRLV